MSFLQQLVDKRHKLKATNTIITYENGNKFMESKLDGSLHELQEKSYGFVIDTKPDLIPACIFQDSLYLGSQDSVIIENLIQYNISHILSIGIEIHNLKEQFNISKHKCCIKYIPCLDLEETNLLETILLPSNYYINTALKNNGKILVHCNAGVSRSAAVIIGYLIIEQKMNFLDAFQLVKSKRQCIQPNHGFIRQLKMLSNQN